MTLIQFLILKAMALMKSGNTGFKGNYAPLAEKRENIQGGESPWECGESISGKELVVQKG